MLYNIKNYGATGNGSTDDTTAIQTAISACISGGGGIIYAPPGTYKLSAELTFPGTSGGNTSFLFLGAGGRATTFVQATLSSNVFASSGYPSGTALSGCAFRDFGVTYAGTPTAGAVFAFPWIDTTQITQIFVQQCYDFCDIGQGGSTTTFGNLWIGDNRVNNVNGTCFNFRGQGGNVFITDTEFFGIGNATGCSCLQWNDTYCDTFWMRGLDFEDFGSGLNFTANSAMLQCGLTDAYIEDVMVDAPQNYGLAIGSSSATGTFSRIKFRNLWITTSGASTPCLAIGLNNGAALQDLTFSGCNFSGTAYGVAIVGDSGSIISDVAFLFCQIYQSPIAIILGYTNNISFMDCSIGTPYGGGSGAVLYTSNTNTGFLFQGNRVTGYGTFFGNTGLSAIGTGSLIANNLGVDPYGALSAPTYTASSPATNAFPFQVRVSVSGASAVAINGTATGAGAGAYILLPGETITPTGSGSWTWYGL